MKSRRSRAWTIGFEKNNTITRAASVVLDFETLGVIETATAHRPTSFPYIPGLLSFREVPCVLEAMLKLGAKPDLLFCDGQGIAHPRHFGIAAHLRLLLDLPAIGVGKSRLTGTHDEVPAKKGTLVPLMDKGEQIGVVLRSADQRETALHLARPPRLHQHRAKAGDEVRHEIPPTRNHALGA